LITGHLVTWSPKDRILTGPVSGNDYRTFRDMLRLNRTAGNFPRKTPANERFSTPRDFPVFVRFPFV
jgi:hypothetical protein